MSPIFVLIIRSCHERGPIQWAAMTELNARRAWLSDDQLVTAGVPRAIGEALKDFGHVL